MTNSSIKESKTGLQAPVFGASGITGWAITNSALTYPTSSTFSQVVGLTSRPLSLETSGFPTDSRLQLYSGLDLSQDAETIKKYVRKIENIERITHVYFACIFRRYEKLGVKLGYRAYEDSLCASRMGRRRIRGTNQGEY